VVPGVLAPEELVVAAPGVMVASGAGAGVVVVVVVVVVVRPPPASPYTGVPRPRSCRCAPGRSLPPH